MFAVASSFPIQNYGYCISKTGKILKRTTWVLYMYKYFLSSNPQHIFRKPDLFGFWAEEVPIFGPPQNKQHHRGLVMWDQNSIPKHYSLHWSMGIGDSHLHWWEERWANRKTGTLNGWILSKLQPKYQYSSPSHSQSQLFSWQLNCYSPGQNRVSLWKASHRKWCWNNFLWSLSTVDWRKATEKEHATCDMVWKS